MSRRLPLSEAAWRVLAAVHAGKGTAKADDLVRALKMHPEAFVRSILALQSRGLIRPVRYGLGITRDGLRALSSRFAH